MDALTKNYIFDLGNVLVRFDPMYMTAACVPDPKLCSVIAPVVFDRLYWDPLDYGGIRDDELKNACHARLPAELHGIADQVYDRWMENLPLNPGMRALVEDIKAKGGKLYLLSNVSIGFAEQYHHVSHLRELFSLFDGLVFSGPLGIIKPDPAIFHHILNKFSLQPEHCVFIDDNAANVAGAEAVGIRAYHFDGDPQKLREYLKL